MLSWEAAQAIARLIHEAPAPIHSSIRGRPRRRGCGVPELRHYVRRESFSVQRHTAVPMETRGLVAVWDDAETRMTVFGITKVPFFNRTMLASMLDLPESSVVMKVADAGGGFGVRGEFYPEDFLIPFLARRA